MLQFMAKSDFSLCQHLIRDQTQDDLWAFNVKTVEYLHGAVEDRFLGYFGSISCSTLHSKLIQVTCSKW